MGLKNLLQRGIDKAWSAKTGKPVPARQAYSSHKRKGVANSSLRRSFAAAKVDNLTSSFSGSFLTINEELRRDLRRLRARSRQLCMDNDYAKKFVNVVKANVIGVNGIVMQSRAVDDKGALDEADNNFIEKRWKEWGAPRICSTTGRLSWHAVQSIAAASMARDGEVLIQMVDKPSHPFGFVIKILSADYLDESHNENLSNGNRITMGVETDSDGLVVAYHLRDEPTNQYQNVYRLTKYRRIPAADIIHLFVADYPEQKRGMPWMHTAIRRLNMLGGYEEAELVAARVGASKMGFYTSPDGDGPTPGEMAADGQEGDDFDLVQDADPGHFEQLPQGVDFTTFDPDHPSTAYADFTKSVLRGATAGMNVAYSSVANDLTDVNFSSIRAGVLDERDQWRMLHKFMIEQMHDVIYKRWLRAAISSGWLPIPFKKIDSKYSAIHWQPRGWPWVDPLKDSKSHSENIAGGMGTRTEALGSQGKDFKETIEQLAYEEQVAEQYGVDITPVGKMQEVLNNDNQTDTQNN